jgi:hypothetical protein
MMRVATTSGRWDLATRPRRVDVDSTDHFREASFWFPALQTLLKGLSLTCDRKIHRIRRA